MTDAISPNDFAESFTIELASALICGISPRSHPKGILQITQRMRDDAIKGSLTIVNGRISRAEIIRWLASSNFRSEYKFNLDGKGTSAEPFAANQLGNRERNTLLTIIAVLCKEAKIDYTKPAKAAGLIQSTAQKMGVAIGETTIEGHLKKVPDALASKVK